MERRKAMAVAAAGAMLSATMAVVATSGALRGGGPESSGEVAQVAPSTTATMPVESTTTLEPVVVTETRDVYDTFVIPTAVTATAPAGDRSGDPVAESLESRARPSAAPPPTTTVPSTTSTTRPPGVPEDWPADRPIPPMPEDCEKPQLEDNGTWNCDH